MADRTRNMGVPEFRSDGYLPEGVHIVTLADLTFRFGSQNRRRRRLIFRLRHWVELAQAIGARRLLVDGSFVTAKADPEDIDAVILLPADFESQIEAETDAAQELAEILLSRQPEELFGVENEGDWLSWVEFFSRTKELDRRRKGLVEIHP